MKRVCLFCGAKKGLGTAYAQATRAFGAALARRGLGLVYGGGHVGLMGVAADAALAGGGEVVGVIPQALVDAELAHEGATEMRVVRSMHERKAVMTELSDAFVAAPGGIGTLEELFEIYSWATLGIHAKPVGLLSVNGFYGPLLAFLDQVVTAGFASDAARSVPVVAEDPDELLDRLAAWTPPDFGHKLSWTER